MRGTQTNEINMFSGCFKGLSYICFGIGTIFSSLVSQYQFHFHFDFFFSNLSYAQDTHTDIKWYYMNWISWHNFKSWSIVHHQFLIQNKSIIINL